MAINKQSFAKKFAENGQRTVWEEAQYKLGWETVGIRPPTKEQFNYLFHHIDEKLAFLSDMAEKKADTTQSGIVQLSSATNSEREDIAATSKAVKIAYDKAEEAARLALPSGAVLYFAGQTAPAGWLKANGAAVSRTLYANLFAAIGTTYGTGDGSTTFNLPDLRGEFVRGWDDGRGADNGRVFGSAQSDAIRNIKGSLESLYGSYRYTLYTKADGAFTTDSDDGVNTTFRSSNDDHANRQKRVVFDASRSVPTAAENRPRNLALLACIKI